MDIKELIKEYVLIDDEITEINKTVKEARVKKKEKEEMIMEYMLDNNIDTLDLPSGKLKVSSSVLQKKISKNEIIPVLVHNDIDGENINKIIDELFTEESTQEKTKIVRTKR
jgi:hypothetical protein